MEGSIMKQLSFLVVLLFCFGCCYFSACQSSQYTTVATTKLEDNMWVLEASDHTDMFLVE